MQTSATRDHLSRALLDFAWHEWAQMGVLASASGLSPWAQDPEALVIFTLEVARDDPRLFDEVLDWMLANESLLSVRRLRAACVGDDDERLLEASIAWLNDHGWRARPLTPGDGAPHPEPVPLYRSLSSPAAEIDQSFSKRGLLRPLSQPSGKAGTPDLLAPINLAFRLRQLLGMGVRSEVVRVLLSSRAPSLTTAVVTRAVGYSKRNVHEALSALEGAGVVSAWTVGSARSYATDRNSWSALLGVGARAFPIHQDWPQLLGPLRETLRFLGRPDLDRHTAYMLGSLTRDLLEQVSPDLAYAGIRVPRSQGADNAWDELVATIDATLSSLRPELFSVRDQHEDAGQVDERRSVDKP